MSKQITFPVMDVKMVAASKVKANDYNPNKVASPEMELLAISIMADGVTQPIVTFYDSEADQYIVIDGFHRYTVLTKRFKCKEVPVVVVDKPLADRMASTVRHNRARGKHQVNLMSDLLLSMIKSGMSDSQVAKHLGMSAEEVLRLKQQTGIAGLFKGQHPGRAWVSDINDPTIN
jgi:ParB-like chromosome segregation protein Spo0J